MGLLTIIRKSRQKEREMRILFLGLDNAGKTTILKKINGEDISSKVSLVTRLGFSLKLRAISSLFDRRGATRHSYTLNIWDVGGQRTLRPYWRNYFEQTDAIVWVVDSGDRMRMRDCREELHNLLLEDRLSGASLLVFANKQDIHGSMSDLEISEESFLTIQRVSRVMLMFIQALDLPGIKSHNRKIWSCSAVTGLNLIQGLDWVVEDVAHRLYYSSTSFA